MCNAEVHVAVDPFLHVRAISIGYEAEENGRPSDKCKGWKENFLAEVDRVYQSPDKVVCLPVTIFWHLNPHRQTHEDALQDIPGGKVEEEEDDVQKTDAAYSPHFGCLKKAPERYSRFCCRVDVALTRAATARY